MRERERGEDGEKERKTHTPFVISYQTLTRLKVLIARIVVKFQKSQLAAKLILYNKSDADF